jgi:hypothetical protein
MPTISRAFVATSFAYLVAGLGLAAWGAAHGPAGGPDALAPVALHFVTVGWITQMIAGVAYWMFPRRSRTEPPRDRALATFAYVALNLGLVLRAVAEPRALAATTPPSLPLALAAAAILQWAATVAIAALLWPRVRPR